MTASGRLREQGEITKGNSGLNSAIQNYFSSSQKILDKKIQAYELLWSCILNIRDDFPSGISLVHEIFPDNWFDKSEAFSDLINNPKMSYILNSYNKDRELPPILEHGKSLMPLKPYLSDKTYKLFYTYQGLIGRITHQFIDEYEKGKVFNWKKDKSLESILIISLTKEELKYIKDIKIGSLQTLTDILEYKILQDFRDNLNIKETTSDSISYIKDIEQILTASKN